MQRPEALEAKDVVFHDPLSQEMRAKHHIRAVVVVALGLALLAVVYGLAGQWARVVPMLLCVSLLPLCLWVNQKGLTDHANAMLLWSVFALVCTLMWMGQGLRSVAVLTFPVILLLAGLISNVRHFLALLVAMLAYGAVLTLVTDVWHIRRDGLVTTPLRFLLDYCLLLSAGAYAAWVAVTDLRNVLEAFQLQITKQRESEQRYRFLSQHDSLTELPNRFLGRELVEAAIARAERNGSRVALVFVDLDHFKSINDSLGHSAGDDYLQQVAQRLHAAVRRADMVARQGGDEFVIGLTDVGDTASVAKVAQTVVSCFDTPFDLQGSRVAGSCSVGVAIYPDDGQDYETLLRQADAAMYRAKAGGRNGYRLHGNAVAPGANVSPEQGQA